MSNQRVAVLQRALDSLVELRAFVVAQQDNPIPQAGGLNDRLRALDAATSAACRAAGLSFPSLFEETVLSPFGKMRIPCDFNLDGLRVVATDNWLHAVDEMKAAVEQRLDISSAQKPPAAEQSSSSAPTASADEHARAERDQGGGAWLSDTTLPPDASSAEPNDSRSSAPSSDDDGADELPPCIDRYQVRGQLGKGGFGTVHLAYDEELQRQVAIKVPRRDRISKPEDVEKYLIEAQTVARMRHPNIVRVYDVGQLADRRCYVVSEYIPGRNLASHLDRESFTYEQSAELVATIARALHYAHRRKVVHRDIKPANILLDENGTPFVADFGLALREQDYGKPVATGGTLAYMSPEQARGEGHLVDGRSDVFSLGVIFYQLLTGELPFQGPDARQVVEMIKRAEARPPRQVKDTIPDELERICLKALSKNLTQRYTTAKDCADDLLHFCASEFSAAAPTEERPRMVARGLRSFDQSDSGFFLRLLPGHRDRDGVPESIGFWTSRIEAQDPDDTFRVGVLYGPSGSGKSSFVKAGLMPQLSRSVNCLYTEASSEGTEDRVLRRLSLGCPSVPAPRNLTDAVAAIRRGDGAARRVCLILDQFEQWLYANPVDSKAELVQALRQCDGTHIQFLLVVRDDFWMGIIRFMRELDVALLEGRNSAAVDLFDVSHAKGVLAEYGRAVGQLPDPPKAMSKEQQAFLERATADLAEDGRVICVRIALFAQMMKSRRWVPGTLRDVGGVEGVGGAFLEETFGDSAPPLHRAHARSAREVLIALLPPSGANIKGSRCSRQQLLDVSGYAERPREFDELLQILDSESRLLTPVEAEPDATIEPDGRASSSADEQYYQLTHDYLVPSLRGWLVRKQGETSRGRARLLLERRSDEWNGAGRISRHLPSLSEVVRILCLTRPSDRTATESEMVKRASRFHGLRVVFSTVLAALVVTALVAIVQTKLRDYAEAVLDADDADVMRAVEEIDVPRRLVNPYFEQALTSGNSARRLRARLALLGDDHGQIDILLERLLTADTSEYVLIRDALADFRDSVVEPLWKYVENENPQYDGGKWFRATCALAQYAPDDTRWQRFGPELAHQLASASPQSFGFWLESARPVRGALVDPLGAIFRDTTETELRRSRAMGALTAYLNDARDLVVLVQDADEAQFEIVLDALRRYETEATRLLRSALSTPPDADGSEASRETGAQRQANVAAALLRLGSPDDVRPLFRQTSDPRVRSTLIHRMVPFGVSPEIVVDWLDHQPDAETRFGLICALGQFPADMIDPDDRGRLVRQIAQWHQSEPDPGVHAATEWLLRRWGQVDTIKAMAREAGHLDHASGQQDVQRSWFVDAADHTMVVMKGPVEFLMGSPPEETDEVSTENQHRRRIDRTFAVGSQEVTVRQFEEFVRFLETDEDARFAGARRDLPRFQKCCHDFEGSVGTANGPQVCVSWYLAAEYCNWLSLKNGIPPDQWCYLSRYEGNEVKAARGYLDLIGYRLPTEAEWEYACRGGTVTKRYFGHSDELLPDYAWYVDNADDRTHAVGELVPNQYGLFDTLGNAMEWCHDRQMPYPSDATSGSTSDVEDEGDMIQGVQETVDRRIRGLCFVNMARDVYAAGRYHSYPYVRMRFTGFRVAKTVRTNTPAKRAAPQDRST